MIKKAAKVGSERRAAAYSDDERHRYDLVVDFEDAASTARAGTCVFIGLNPSTATELVDDRTVRRCKNFALGWGFARFVMLNAYGFRSTDPLGLWTVADPVGPGNDRAIRRWTAEADRICLAWGTHVRDERRERLHSLLVPVADRCVCLGLNNNGSPKHPLYLAASTQPVIYPGHAVRT